MKALSLAYNLPSITNKILLFILVGKKLLAAHFTEFDQELHRFGGIHVYPAILKLTSSHYPDLQRSVQDLFNRLFFI